MNWTLFLLVYAGMYFLTGDLFVALLFGCIFGYLLPKKREDGKKK